MFSCTTVHRRTLDIFNEFVLNFITSVSIISELSTVHITSLSNDRNVLKSYFNNKEFKILDKKEMPKKYENNCNFAKYSKFPFKV